MLEERRDVEVRLPCPVHVRVEVASDGGRASDERRDGGRDAEVGADFGVVEVGGDAGAVGRVDEKEGRWEVSPRRNERGERSR